MKKISSVLLLLKARLNMLIASDPLPAYTGPQESRRPGISHLYTRAYKTPAPQNIA